MRRGGGQRLVADGRQRAHVRAPRPADRARGPRARTWSATAAGSPMVRTNSVEVYAGSCAERGSRRGRAAPRQGRSAARRPRRRRCGPRSLPRSAESALPTASCAPQCRRGLWLTTATGSAPSAVVLVERAAADHRHAQRLEVVPGAPRNPARGSMRRPSWTPLDHEAAVAAERAVERERPGGPAVTTPGTPRTRSHSGSNACITRSRSTRCSRGRVLRPVEVDRHGEDVVAAEARRRRCCRLAKLRSA